MTALKLALVLGLWAAATIGAALAADRSDRWRRLLIALAVFSFAWPPVATFNYQFGTHYNVRGIEFCFAEMIASGLLLARLRQGVMPLAWLSPLVALWVLHLAVLLLSSWAGANTTLSLWYCWRTARGLLVLLSLAVVVRERREVEAVLSGLILTCLWNEWYVLQQKYLWHAWQARGAFDHQNAMGMYMILSGTTLFGAWLFRGVTPRLRWPLFVGVICSAHGIFAGLSRGSMFFYTLAMAATAIGSFALAPDRHKLRAMGLIAAVGMLGSVLVAPSVIERLHDRGNLASERTREVMIQVAREMHHDRPWLGLGPNNYALAVNNARYAHLADIIDRERGNTVNPNAKRGQIESLYWGLLAETGYIGFATMLLFMIASVLLIGAKAILCRDELYRGIALAGCLALTANYLQCLLEHTLLHPQNLYLWMALVALGVAVPWRSATRGPVASGLEPAVAATPDTVPAADPVAVGSPSGGRYWT
jgi:hypothetical protein